MRVKIKRAFLGTKPKYSRFDEKYLFDGKRESNHIMINPAKLVNTTYLPIKRVHAASKNDIRSMSSTLHPSVKTHKPR